uniref:Tubulin--tyrosine ligase-like protein 9 n=1 Tax=Amphora coffeiformis TaxID=265554 RepID=A0A7S3L5X7_9STRA
MMLYIHYLKKDYGYIEWPTQPWYQEQKSLVETKQYYCPLGRRVVDLCDEPQFGQHPRFFFMGRQYLDEKDQLYRLVPELMPLTFASIAEAQQYQEENGPTLWFVKKVNQNGGRAVQVQHHLPNVLEKDDQLQAHIPRPLLWDTKKCHVKTYQWIGSVKTAEGCLEWRIYQHDLYYLAIADEPWSLQDTSDQVQITTMRRQRLYRHHPWRLQWNLTQLCQEYFQTVMKRAIEGGKLQVPSVVQGETTDSHGYQTLQFEIHSADWMLDEDGRMYLIECNGIPVLYDPGQTQPLLTRGLNLYDGLYHDDPETAVVNDHDLIQEAVQLAIKGTLPEDSLWKRLLTMPAVVADKSK